jgi:hypothetical protein
MTLISAQNLIFFFFKQGISKNKSKLTFYQKITQTIIKNDITIDESFEYFKNE